MSNKKQETSADIIAIMRDAAMKGDYDDQTVKDWADRLEAARKREKAAIEADALAVGGIVEAARHQPGNAAAMREALVAVKKSIDGIGASALDCDLEILKASLLSICSRLSARIKKALAAPPRNCDIYTTEDAVDKATVTVRDECDGCPSMDMEARCVFCMVRWLLAPAKKGGAK